MNERRFKRFFAVFDSSLSSDMGVSSPRRFGYCEALALKQSLLP
jgi:hypothetical protein